MVTREELRSLRQGHDEARARRNWEGLQRRRVRGRGRGWLGVGAFAGVLVAAALLLWFLPASIFVAAAGPLTAEGRELSGDVPESVSLDDASRIEVSAETDLEILENTGDRLRFWLHEGRAGFDVTPHGPRRWMIESGQVTVEVLGTSFTVSRSEHDVTVSVTRGVVLVRGPTTPGGLLRLGAGESVTVPAAPPTLTAAPAPHADVVAEVEPAHEAVPAVRSATAAREETTASSREPSITPPVAAIEPAITPTVEPAIASPTELLERADVLRREGRYDEAASLLGAIARGPRGPEASLAAFTLGRLELERRSRPHEAAEAFEQAIALGLREPLLEDARARMVEALSRAGDARATETAAVTYLALYPEGRYVSEVERWSAQP